MFDSESETECMTGASLYCHQSSSVKRTFDLWSAPEIQATQYFQNRNCENLSWLLQICARPLNTEMAANTRTPLLAHREKVYTVNEHEEKRDRDDSTDSQLTTLADYLGMQPDSLSCGTSSERDRENTSKRERSAPYDPVVTISHEQLEELLTAMDTTSDLLRQVGMSSVDLENLTRRRRWGFPILNFFTSLTVELYIRVP